MAARKTSVWNERLVSSLWDFSGPSTLMGRARLRREAQPGYGRNSPATVSWGDPDWLSPSKDLLESQTA